MIVKKRNNKLLDKIKNNENLSDIEKQYLWTNYKEFVPENKGRLKLLIANYLMDNVTNLNFINTSKVNDMSYLFSQLETFDISVGNIDISDWDVSHVTNMGYMFYHCFKFTSDLSRWDVSNVTNMNMMFHQCYKFNSDLNKWNISNVKRMSHMFYQCESLNISNMFYGTKK